MSDDFNTKLPDTARTLTEVGKGLTAAFSRPLTSGGVTVDGINYLKGSVGSYLAQKGRVRYSHRNGETEPPTEVGYYWVRGSMSPNDNVGLIAVEGVAHIVPPSDDLGMEDYFFQLADMGLYHRIAPSEILCRWWGPVLPPWETASE